MTGPGKTAVAGHPDPPAANGRARQAVRIMVTRVIQLAFGGITMIVVARALHPQGRGACAVLVSIAMTAQGVGHLSIEQSHTWLWSSTRNRRAIAANSLLLGPAVGTLTALVAGAVVAVLVAHGMPVPGYGALALALAAVPLGITGLYVTNTMVLRGRFDLVNRGVLLGSAAQAAALTLLAVTGRLSVAWFVGLWVASLALSLAVLVPALPPARRSCDLSLARRALIKGMRYHVGLLSVFLLFRLDILILNAMVPAAAVGLYSVAVTLIEMTRLATDATARVALSRQMEGDQDQAAAFTAWTTRLTVPLATVSVGAMCAAAPVLIPLLYGSSFAGSVAPLLALSPGLLALTATRTISAFLLRLDRPMLVSLTSVASLVVNVVLNLALIPVWGIVGSAVASSVGYVLLAGLQVAWFLRATRSSPSRLLPGSLEVRYLLATFYGLARRQRFG